MDPAVATFGGPIEGEVFSGLVEVVSNGVNMGGPAGSAHDDVGEDVCGFSGLVFPAVAALRYQHVIDGQDADIVAYLERFGDADDRDG